MLSNVEGPPSSPTPSSSPSPYRTEKPLTELIPPDRRREKTVAIIVASMIAGVAVWTLGGWAVEAMRARDPVRPPPPPTFVSGRITPTLLGGPGGPTHVPLQQMHVVHVWLQGCQDCMPAFEAMRDLSDRGGLGLHVPVLNVAYGEADQTWAHRYGVGGDLLFDTNGAAFVKPLGISTFTTIVVDPNGNVIHRDRPDRPGYRDRIRAAVGEPEGQSPNDPLLVPEEPKPDPAFGAAAVERVVATHRIGVRRTCWERRGTGPQNRVPNANVTITARIAPDGRVESTSSSALGPTTPPSPEEIAVGTCVEQQVRSWRFPPPGSVTTVNIPFRFIRE